MYFLCMSKRSHLASDTCNASCQLCNIRDSHWKCAILFVFAISSKGITRQPKAASFFVSIFYNSSRDIQITSSSWKWSFLPTYAKSATKDCCFERIFFVFPITSSQSHRGWWRASWFKNDDVDKFQPITSLRSIWIFAYQRRKRRTKHQFTKRTF